jgi:hypothetical protein
MNGNSIQPTVELATTNGNGFYPYMYGNNNGFFGDNGIWAILLLALLWGGNNGFGGFGGNGWNNVATTDYVSSEFTQRDINGGFQNQSNLISNGFTNLAQDVCNLKSDVLENRYAAQLSACNTQRDILTQTNELNTNLLTQALQNQAHVDSCCCDIKSLVREEADKTRSLITQNTIQDLRDRLQAAENKLSDDNVINSVLPRSIPAYITASPYQSIFPYGFNNGFYGNGFYGNTIV